MAELPSGTVSLLFSDIEGSTVLLSRLGPAYADALDGQRQVLRKAWDEHGGTELGTEGDSFFVVFGTAEAAVRAAARAQQELAAFDWSGGEQVRVRMGIHTGTPQIHDGAYVGMDVHRAARIAGAAHGGQVVLSSATAELVDSRLPSGVGLRDLGRHRLKDIAVAEHLLHLTIEGLPSEFPPLKTLGALSSLPVPPTPLLGRDGELAELTALLASPDVRCLTLTGPGGSGKTRLVIALAQELVARFPGGVFFVPFAALTAADLMWNAIGEVLDAPADARTPSGLCTLVAHRNALLVLDNLEQVSGAETVVASLLDEAPDVVVLVTSRRPLHLAAEHEFPVSPLALPQDSTVAEAESSGAVQLFVRQARRVRPRFAVTADNATDVVAVCRRLDGLPLAIELAAARSKLLSPAALLSRLESTVELRDRTVGRPVRQQTLRDTIAWSYDLLTSDLQAVFRRLGVFAGGADLVAVRAVAGTGATGVDVLDAVADLVDASLITVTEDSAGEPRIAMLQTMADFATEVLATDGDLWDAKTRHAEHYLAMATTDVAQVRTGPGQTAHARLRQETDNFRAALTWALKPDEVVPPAPELARIGLRLCAELSWFWNVQTRVPDFSRWCQRAVDVDSGADSRERATVLIALGWSDLPPDDPRPLAALEEALAMSDRLDDMAGRSQGLAGLAELHLKAGALDPAAEMASESADLASRLGDASLLAESLYVQTRVALQRGEAEAALELSERAQELDRRRGAATGIVAGEVSIASALLIAGHGAEAVSRLHVIADDVLKADNPLLNIGTLGAYAHACVLLDDPERAARLLGAHWAQWAAIGFAIDPDASDERTWLEQSGLAKARETLGEHRWALALETGAGYTLEEALDDARRINAAT